MTMPAVIPAVPQGASNTISQLEFALDVACASGAPVGALQTPDGLLLAIRQELLPVMDATIAAAAAQSGDITIPALDINLGHFDNPPDWDRVRDSLRRALYSALSPYLRAGDGQHPVGPAPATTAAITTAQDHATLLQALTGTPAPALAAVEQSLKQLSPQALQVVRQKLAAWGRADDDTGNSLSGPAFDRLAAALVAGGTATGDVLSPDHAPDTLDHRNGGQMPFEVAISAAQDRATLLQALTGTPAPAQAAVEQSLKQLSPQALQVVRQKLAAWGRANDDTGDSLSGPAFDRLATALVASETESAPVPRLQATNLGPRQTTAMQHLAKMTGLAPAQDVMARLLRPDTTSPRQDHAPDALQRWVAGHQARAKAVVAALDDRQVAAIVTALVPDTATALRAALAVLDSAAQTRAAAVALLLRGPVDVQAIRNATTGQLRNAVEILAELAAAKGMDVLQAAELALALDGAQNDAPIDTVSATTARDPGNADNARAAHHAPGHGATPMPQYTLSPHVTHDDRTAITDHDGMVSPQNAQIASDRPTRTNTGDGADHIKDLPEGDHAHTDAATSHDRSGRSRDTAVASSGDTGGQTDLITGKAHDAADPHATSVPDPAVSAHDRLPSGRAGQRDEARAPEQGTEAEKPDKPAQTDALQALPDSERRDVPPDKLAVADTAPMRIDPNTVQYQANDDQDGAAQQASTPDSAVGREPANPETQLQEGAISSPPAPPPNTDTATSTADRAEQQLIKMLTDMLGSRATRMKQMMELVHSALGIGAVPSDRGRAAFWVAALAAATHGQDTDDRIIAAFVIALLPDTTEHTHHLRVAVSRLGYAQAGVSHDLRRAARSALQSLILPEPPKAGAEHADRTSMVSFPKEEPQATHLLTRQSGLVLLHPYLKMLFDRLEIGTDQKGLLRGDLARALATLHWLAFGTAAHEPVADPLVKCLLGVPADAEMPDAADLIPDDTAMIDSLIAAVIAQWGRLGKTSPDGLRAAFILRDGLLDPAPDAPRLTVDAGPYDMLLDGLPWAINLVALPWMPAPLSVNWRQRDG